MTSNRLALGNDSGRFSALAGFWHRRVRLRSALIRPHFVLIAVGTHGDVLPLLTLATSLRERGNQVTVIAPITYDTDTLSQRGVAFVPLSPAEQYAHAVSDFGLLNTRYRVLFGLRHGLAWNQHIFRTLQATAAPNVVSISTDVGMIWADYSAYRCLNIPSIRLRMEPPRLSNAPAERQELDSRALEQRTVVKLEREWMNTMREFGFICRVGHISRLRRYCARTLPMIGLYPAWLAPDHSSGVARAFGFIRPTAHEGREPLPLRLEPGRQKLLIFSAGTVGVSEKWSELFFRVSVGVCRRLGCVGLLLGGQLPSRLEETDFVAWRRFFPLHRALPHASAIIHHGGIGTAALAIEHRVPQLIVPRFSSQASNAEWLRRLGLALVLDQTKFAPDAASHYIKGMLVDKSYARNLAAYASRCYEHTTLNSVCRFLECQSYLLRRVDARQRSRATCSRHSPEP